MKVIVHNQPLPAKTYARIALVCCGIFLLLLFIYLWRLPVLTEHGLSSFFLLVLLVPLAVGAAIMLHGVMRSSSSANYEKRGLRVKLGGATVVFFLLMGGSLKVIPDTPQTFDFTIRPQAADANSTVITSGAIVIYLDSDRRSQRIGLDGEVDFKQIPWRFRGATVDVRPKVDGYEETPQPVVLSGTVAKLLLVKLAPPVTVFSGSVALTGGKWQDIRVVVEGHQGEASVDKFGRFEIPVSGSPGDKVRVKVFVDGNLAYDDIQSLPGGVTIHASLHR